MYGTYAAMGSMSRRNASPLRPLESFRSYPKSPQCSIASGKAKTDIAASFFSSRGFGFSPPDERFSCFATKREGLSFSPPGAYSRGPSGPWISRTTARIALADSRCPTSHHASIRRGDEGVTCAFDRFARNANQREKEASSFSRGGFVFASAAVEAALVEPTPTRYAYAAPAQRWRRVAKCT